MCWRYQRCASLLPKWPMVWITWPVSSWFTVIWPPEIFFYLSKTWWVPCRLYYNIFQLLHTKSMIGDQLSKEHCKAQNCHFTVLKRLFLSIALCILSLHNFTHDCSSYLKKWRLLFNNKNNQSLKFDKNVTVGFISEEWT